MRGRKQRDMYIVRSRCSSGRRQKDRLGPRNKQRTKETSIFTEQ